MMGKGILNFTRICPVCHTEFQPTNAHQFYCSLECRKTGHNLGLRANPNISRGAGFAIDAKPESHADNMQRIADMVKNDPFYGQHQLEEARRRK